MLEPAEQHAGEFLRLQVHRDRHVVDIDLARDWRQHPPVRMQIGPHGRPVFALMGGLTFLHDRTGLLLDKGEGEPAPDLTVVVPGQRRRRDRRPA